MRMRRLQGLGFATFCVLAGSRWLVDNAFPSEMPALAQGGLHYLIIAAITLAVWPISRRPGGPAFSGSKKERVKLIVGGVFLLGFPFLLQNFAHTATEEDGAALFALVPLFIVVGVAAFGEGSSDRRLMMPALVGLAGALLLLPFQLPATPYGAVLFAVVLVAVLMTAGASVWLYKLLQGQSVIAAVVLVSVGNAVVLCTAAGLNHPAGFSAAMLRLELLRCVALDLPQMFLLVWLLRKLPPVRLSARYLVVPLLTAIEGIVLLHPMLDLRMGTGLSLMASGAAILLIGRSEDESGGSLKLDIA